MWALPANHTHCTQVEITAWIYEICRYFLYVSGYSLTIASTVLHYVLMETM